MILKKEKVIGKLNTFDIFVITVVIAGAIVIASYFLGGTLSSKLFGLKIREQKDVYFTLELSQATEELASKMQNGDFIRDFADDYYYGIVSDIKVTPSEVISHDILNQKFKTEIVSEKVDIRLTVKCNGTETETDITAEGHTITVGLGMTLASKSYVASGFVIDIRTEERQ